MKAETQSNVSQVVLEVKITRAPGSRYLAPGADPVERHVWVYDRSRWKRALRRLRWPLR